MSFLARRSDALTFCVLRGRADVRASRQPGRGALTDVDQVGSREVHANPWLSVRGGTVRRVDWSTGTFTVVDDGGDIVLSAPPSQRFSVGSRYAVLRRRVRLAVANSVKAASPAASRPIPH